MVRRSREAAETRTTGSIAPANEAKLESLAAAFDMPVDSREHRVLAETAWLAGPLVSVRYLLGRLSDRNLFRESDDVVRLSLQEFIRQIGSAAGASLFADLQAWPSAVIILRHRVEMMDSVEPTQNSILLKALCAFISNPALTDSELAVTAGTTEKQVARMSEITVLRRVWKLSRMREA